ncbi:hypothetical protein AB0H12_29845 [Actinosynnema sp. NPDC023794]
MCGLVVVLALAWSVVAHPTSVPGEAHPWSGNTALADAVAAFERCAEEAGPDETYAMGPTHLREDGELVVGAVSDDTLVQCGVARSGVSVSTSKPVDHSVREVPFGVITISGYGDRPGGTVVGYAGDDVAAVNFRTPDGRVIPARVRRGVYLFELPRTADCSDLTHEAFDATGAVIAGR